MAPFFTTGIKFLNLSAKARIFSCFSNPKALAVLTLLFLSPCNSFSQEEEPVQEKLFSPAELQVDLDSLYTWINATHPDLYFQTEKARADKRWTLVRKQIKKPMKRLEFARLISPLLAQYQDGHLGLGAYFWEDAEFNAYKAEGGKFFPLQVKVKNGKIYVVEGPAGGNIKAGAEIISINGERASDITALLFTQIPADTRGNAEATVSRLFNTTLWYIYGWGNNSQIIFQNPSENRKLKAHLPGSSFEEVVKFNFPKGNKKLDLLLFEKEGLAVIETFGLIHNKQTRNFLDSAFTVIKSKNIRHVAVDIRKNGGGNSAAGNEILKYLTRKPYSQAIKTEKRKSDYLLSKPYNKWILEIFENPKYKDSVVNNRLIFEGGPSVVPVLEKPELFFEGNFYLLTGPRTFSSAHMMAAAVKEYSLGKVIGESTGSRMIFFGEPAVFYLPNTKIQGIIPTVKHWMPGHTNENISASIEPDVLIATGPKELAGGKDPVLEYLKSLPLNRQL